MNILTQKVTDNFLSYLQKELLQTLGTVKEPQSPFYTINNFAQLVEKISTITQEIGRQALINSINEIDISYRDSEIRKRDYYVKDNRERTIVTVFGTVTYKRTIYQNKYTKKCFTYVDRKLGLQRYDKFDPLIKGMVLEQYANSNSMIKVGEAIGKLLSGGFSTCKERNEYRISRQAVHSIIKKTPPLKIEYKKRLTTPKKIYIMADEKYVSLQTGEPGRQSAMVKHAVIYESIDKSSKRHSLVNKTHLANIGSKFWEEIYDVLNQLYDIDKIDEIIIQGDGAAWIKKGVSYFDRGKAIFGLDKFHFKQAVEHITKNTSYQNLIISYLLHDTIPGFKRLMQTILDVPENVDRQEKISEKMKYLLNQRIPIRNTYDKIKMGCSMESAISHNLASTFSSRPKAYNLECLKKHVNNRMAYLNNIDMQNTYLKTLDESNIITNNIGNSPNYDFSVFERNLGSDYSVSRWINRIN